MSNKENLKEIVEKLRFLANEIMSSPSCHQGVELEDFCDKLDQEISGIDVITIAPSEGPINISTPGIVDEKKLRASAPSVDVPVNRF